MSGARLDVDLATSPETLSYWANPSDASPPRPLRQSLRPGVDRKQHASSTERAVQSLHGEAVDEAEARAADLVDLVTGRLVVDLADLVDRSRQQISILLTVLRDAGWPIDSPGVLPPKAAEVAWATVSNSSVLAILDALAGMPHAAWSTAAELTELATEQIDLKSLATNIGAEPSDARRVLQVSASALHESWAAGTPTPEYHRDRWLSIQQDESGGFYKLNLEPAVIIRRNKLVGQGAVRIGELKGQIDLIPVAPAQLRRSDDTLFIDVVGTNGVARPIVRLLTDGEVIVREGSIRLGGAANNSIVALENGRSTAYNSGLLIKGYAADDLRLSLDPVAGGDAIYVAEPIDGEVLATFV